MARQPVLRNEIAAGRDCCQANALIDRVPDGSSIVADTDVCWRLLGISGKGQYGVTRPERCLTNLWEVSQASGLQNSDRSEAEYNSTVALRHSTSMLARRPRLCGYRGLRASRTGSLKQRSALKHFHFWCIQSNRSRRGFSSRKAAPRRTHLCRVEVKML